MYEFLRKLHLFKVSHQDETTGGGKEEGDGKCFPVVATKSPPSSNIVCLLLGNHQFLAPRAH